MIVLKLILTSYSSQWIYVSILVLLDDRLKGGNETVKAYELHGFNPCFIG